MQNTSGIVVEVKNDRAYVKISRATACESCGACHFGESTLKLKITAINRANAKVGDKVELSMDNVNYFRASFFLYGIPLLAMIFGVLSGYYILSIFNVAYYDIISIGIGIIFTGLSYLGIRYNKDKFEDNIKYLSVITEVISHNELFVVNSNE